MLHACMHTYIHYACTDHHVPISERASDLRLTSFLGSSLRHHLTTQPTSKSINQSIVAPELPALGLAGGLAVAALEVVLLEVDAAEALGAAPPLGADHAAAPPLGRLLLRGRRRAPPHDVLAVVLAVVVPGVVAAVEGVGGPPAPRVVAGVRRLLRRRPVHLLVVPLQVRLALERLVRVAPALEAAPG